MHDRPLYRSNNRDSSRNSSRSQPQLPQPVQLEPLPENYVDAAEAVIRELTQRKRSEQITTSKLRNLFSLVMDLYNQEINRSDSALLESSRSGLLQFRIRMIYEAGREESVKLFVQRARLEHYLKGIGDRRENLIHFAHYMEALVAYHRYYKLGNERC